jgi:hypothetical protein
MPGTPPVGQEIVMPRSTSLVALAMLAATLCGTNATAQTARFSAGTEGWTVIDLSSGGPYTSVLASGIAPTWNPTGGDTGGYISARDPSGNAYFFAAPNSWLGNRSDWFGRRLRFSLNSTINNWNGDRVALLIGGSPTIVLAAPLSPLPPAPPAWQRYDLPIAQGTWRIGTQNGAVASETQIRAVLASLAALRISAEFGSQIEETTGLDSVRIFSPAACPADISNTDGDLPGQPDGVVDNGDFSAFFAAFFLPESDPLRLQADIADTDSLSEAEGGGPDGTVDNGDFTAFFTAFFACVG